MRILRELIQSIRELTLAIQRLRSITESLWRETAYLNSHVKRLVDKT